MITGKNESKTLTKHISCECKCKFDGRKCNSNQKWNKGKCRCKYKKHHICDNSVITCDEILDKNAKSYDEETKIISKNLICETKSFYILLAFSVITVSLLIAFSIYFWLIKYKSKQKHLLIYYHVLPYYVTNDKLININVL